MAREIERRPHDYTNATVRDADRVTKRYVGPDATVRRSREAMALTRLAGVLPVPPLLEVTRYALVLGFVAGVPGQKALLRSPEAVLREVGRMARRLAGLDASSVLGNAPPDATLVHGDFGAQNLLLRRDAPGAGWETTALLDWEWVHPGRPLEDLAWAEWIVRTHHADLTWALPALFDGFGAAPPWPQRHRLMRQRCAELCDFVGRWGGPGIAVWAQRRDATAHFVEHEDPAVGGRRSGQPGPVGRPADRDYRVRGEQRVAGRPGRSVAGQILQPDLRAPAPVVEVGDLARRPEAPSHPSCPRPDQVLGQPNGVGERDQRGGVRDCRTPAISRERPNSAEARPNQNHFLTPVMKLPGSRPTP